MTVVVFDIGNVLIRWTPEAAFGHLFETPEAMVATLQDIDFCGWNLEQDRGRPWHDALAVATAEHRQHIAVFEAYASGLKAAHATPIPESVAILEDLAAKGVELHAITNASVETVNIVSDLHPFMALFGDVVVSGAEKVVKPAPEIFRVFLERNRLKPSDCVFIDDSEMNVAGAAAVGLDAVHFTGAAALRDNLSERGLL